MLELFAQAVHEATAPTPADGAAPSSDGRLVLLAFVFSSLGGAAVWLVGQLWKYLEYRNTGRAAREKTITDHYEELVKRLDNEKAEKEQEKERVKKELLAERERISKELDKVRRKGNRCFNRLAALLAHVRYLERVLSSKGVTFERYEEPPEDEVDKEDEPVPAPAPAEDAHRTALTVLPESEEGGQS